MLITALICLTTSWEKGHITGDENIATENLRRFFEQHFHENNDSWVSGFNRSFQAHGLYQSSGVRQHALLNLVRMHYLRNEISAARKVCYKLLPPLVFLIITFPESFCRRPSLWPEQAATELRCSIVSGFYLKHSDLLFESSNHTTVCYTGYLRPFLVGSPLSMKSKQTFIPWRSCLTLVKS